MRDLVMYIAGTCSGVWGLRKAIRHGLYVPTVTKRTAIRNFKRSLRGDD